MTKRGKAHTGHLRDVLVVEAAGTVLEAVLVGAADSLARLLVEAQNKAGAGETTRFFGLRQ